MDGSALLNVVHDEADGEGLRDIDTEQGRVRDGHSHYMDMVMVASDMNGVTVNIEGLIGMGQVMDREEEEKEEKERKRIGESCKHDGGNEYVKEEWNGNEDQYSDGSSSSSSSSSSSPSRHRHHHSNRSPPSRLQPRMVDHSYTCRYLDEYDMLEMDYQPREPQTPSDFSTVSVTPKLLYILSDGISDINEYDVNMNDHPSAIGNSTNGMSMMMKKNEVLVFNHTCEDLPCSVSSDSCLLGNEG